jgi:hypothetical protein
VDLTRIDGIDVTTAMTVISEIGPDMSRFVIVRPTPSLPDPPPRPSIRPQA